jgi:hypothetical protein
MLQGYWFACEVVARGGPKIDSAAVLFEQRSGGGTVAQSENEKKLKVPNPRTDLTKLGPSGATGGRTQHLFGENHGDPTIRRLPRIYRATALSA